MKNLNMNLPNRLTLIRIALVPLFIACFYIEAPSAIYVACGIFIAAFLTDIADGYLARSRNQITDFGKLMDPIADKLLAASALIMLTANGMLNPIAAIIIIAREFLISGFRLTCVVYITICTINLCDLIIAVKLIFNDSALSYRIPFS